MSADGNRSAQILPRAAQVCKSDRREFLIHRGRTGDARAVGIATNRRDGQRAQRQGRLDLYGQLLRAAELLCVLDQGRAPLAPFFTNTLPSVVRGGLASPPIYARGHRPP